MEFDFIIKKGCEWAFAWGPGFVLACIILVGLYFLTVRVLFKIGNKIAEALNKPAEALIKQADSMDDLTKSLKEYVGRDDHEHHQIIVMLKILDGRLEEMETKLDGIKK